MLKRSLMICILLSLSLGAGAQDLKPIRLPAPRLDGGMTLMHALKERKSQREFSPRILPETVMSNLLWAACGVNRPESGKRTAPSAMNRQEISVYVATAEGLYLYEPKGHELAPVIARDIRSLTGTQSFAGKAPVTLIYVADLKKLGGSTPEEKTLYAAADTGFIAENVYLFCASEKLAVVVRGSIDREGLAGAMKLGESQKIILAQTVGYPAE
jgi:SagB-type dehydrogenase family enzyme